MLEVFFVRRVQENLSLFISLSLSLSLTHSHTLMQASTQWYTGTQEGSNRGRARAVSHSSCIELKYVGWSSYFCSQYPTNQTSHPPPSSFCCWNIHTTTSCSYLGVNFWQWDITHFFYFGFLSERDIKKEQYVSWKLIQLLQIKVLKGKTEKKL
jgi:hypothetical protein